MAIPLEHESLLTLADAANTLPRLNGRKLHLSTLWRWARIGCKGVKLDYVRLGHRIVTSQEALTRFANALAAIETKPISRPRDPAPEPCTRTPERKAKDIAKAREELAGMGMA